MFRGRRVSDWVPDVKELLNSGDDDGALALLAELIRANEVSGMNAPWYTETTAKILHRRKDFAGEINVLGHFLMDKDPLDYSRLRACLRRAEAFHQARLDAEVPPACPACGTLLDKQPKRGSKCVSCGVPLLVRRLRGQQVLIPETGLDEWNRARDIEADRERKLKALRNFRITEAEWEATCAADPDSTSDDVFHVLTRDAVRRVDRGDDPVEAFWVHSAMARLLASEDEDWYEMMRSGHDRLDPYLLALSPRSQRRLIIGCGCFPCVMAPRGWTVGRILEERPLPHRDCERPPCTCHHEPVS